MQIIRNPITFKTSCEIQSCLTGPLHAYYPELSTKSVDNAH